MSISGLSGSVHGYGRTNQPPSFKSIDSNGDGAIGFDELQSSAPGGAKASNSRAQALLKAMDTDNSGSVTADEKSAFDSKLHDQQAGLAFLTQQMGSNADVFASTDTDGDGSVSLAELSNDGAAQGADGDSLQKIFDMIDTDGNGAISKDESSNFLDSVRTAVADVTSGSGNRPSVPPQPRSAAPTDGSSTDLRSLAGSAYSSTSRATDLISVLQSLLKDAA